MAHETDLAMPLEEISSLINSEGCLVLGSICPDGIPAAEIVPGHVDNDLLEFVLPVDSTSYRNIQEDNRVCAVVENAQREFYRMRSVTIHGRADLRTSQPDREQARYTLPLDDIVSFDFSKIKLMH